MDLKVAVRVNDTQIPTVLKRCKLIHSACLQLLEIKQEEAIIENIKNRN